MTSADAMAAQQRVQNAMSDMLNEIDRSHLRKIQLKMHQCAAKCCSNESASLEDTHRCIDACSTPVHSAQDYVQKEVGVLQERLQRCVLECQDRARDKMDNNASDSEADKVKGEFETCAIKCVDANVKVIPNLLKRMRAAFDKNLLN